MYDASGQKKADLTQLVEEHAELVKKIAYHLVSKLPASVQVDDLIQAGMLGLLDAGSQYDPSQGASFTTYASIRIRGSMLDELRRNDWVPKSVHRKSRDLAAAVQRVEKRTGKDASDREIAEEMGISMDEYHAALSDSATCRMSSLDEFVGNGDDHRDTFGDGRPLPTEQLMDMQFQASLVKAIDNLPERERLIMSLYYEEELNLKEIGQVLEVSESRVSQLLKQTHARLRSRLDAHIS